MEDELGLRVGEQPRDVVGECEVVLGPARDEGIVAVLPQPFDEVRPDEPSAARDEDAGHVVGELFGAVIQSTRPSHRGRFAAYHAIVSATPSSQETRGSQPVSRLSFS